MKSKTKARKGILRAAEYNSPIGKFIVMAEAGDLCWISLPSKTQIDLLPEVEWITPDEEICIEEAVAFLGKYFNGETVSWAGRRIPAGSSFHHKVWIETAKIPFGMTVSYGDLAAIAGKPGAARAVGTAMARNPLPILIPCHRVITSAGGMGGFGGGLDMKRWLLKHEHVTLL